MSLVFLAIAAGLALGCWFLFKAQPNTEAWIKETAIVSQHKRVHYYKGFLGAAVYAKYKAEGQTFETEVAIFPYAQSSQFGFKTVRSTSPQTPVVNSPIEIMYNPRAPHQALLASWFPKPFMGLREIILFEVLILGAFGIWYGEDGKSVSARRRERKEQRKKGLKNPREQKFSLFFIIVLVSTLVLIVIANTTLSLGEVEIPPGEWHNKYLVR